MNPTGLGSTRQRAHPRLRQLRVAHFIASDLRERILSGEVGEGGLLPKQEELMAEFGVSLTSVREALRILETEGLVTVLRGKTGGAVAHRPQPAKVAYMLALLLQSESVRVTDVARALQALEPICAATAALRPDRARRVVPQLRRIVEQSGAALDDPDAFVRLARSFHETLVASCGIETLAHLVGAVEQLWSAHVERLARRPADLGAFAQRSVREASLADHHQLVDLIAAGDSGGAEDLARRHFAQPERHSFVARGVTVQAALVANSP